MLRELCDVALNEAEDSCPAATQDVRLNTRNRDASIQAEEIKYGPANVDAPGDYWEKLADHWDTPVASAKKMLCGNCVAFDISPRMKKCMPGPVSEGAGELGYCHMHHFKCHSLRTCRTWAKGGPISDDSKSAEWSKREANESEDEERKDMLMSSLSNISQMASEIKQMMLAGAETQAWQESKIYVAAEDMEAVKSDFTKG
jgi:hypothetical protein